MDGFSGHPAISRGPLPVSCTHEHLNKASDPLTLSVSGGRVTWREMQLGGSFFYFDFHISEQPGLQDAARDLNGSVVVGSTG